MTRSFTLGFVAALLALPSPSAAQESAADAFARGKALHAKGDYSAAIAAFERAYSLKAHHAVLCTIALCHEQMNQFVEAAGMFRRCLKEGAASTPKADSVRKALAAAEARINYVDVTSPGAGGTVYVDGTALGPAPRRVPLNPGRHVIEVRRPGAAPASLTLRLLSGEERNVALAPLESGSPPSVSTPGSAPSRDSAPDRPVSSRRRLSPGWFWTSVALTIALGGAAAIMGGLTYKTASDYDSLPTKETYDTFMTRRLATNILTGLALASAATGTVLFFYTDFSGAHRGRSDEVAAGLGLRGRF